MQRTLIVGMSSLVLATAGAWMAFPSKPGNAEQAISGAPADIGSIAFLAGAWRMEHDNGDICEETWSGVDPAGNSLTGMFRWM